jgi:hypothetical protein
MRTFRGRDTGRFLAVAVSTMLAMATIPVTSAFAEDHDRPEAKPAPKHAAAPKPTPATDSAACKTAISALQKFVTDDRAEDVQEHQARLRGDETTEETAEATDQTEDQTERAQSESLRAAIRQNCEPQPAPQSAACTAALTALKNFRDGDRAEDRAEHQAEEIDRHDGDDNDQLKSGDKAEDQAEKTAEQPLRTAVSHACAPSDR